MNSAGCSNTESTGLKHLHIVLSAAEDLRQAVGHVRESAQTDDIDAARIVLGGIPAETITSLTIAHGLHVPVAGAFLLSGSIVDFDILKSVTRAFKCREM